MHIAEVVTIAKSLPLLRLNTYKSLILSYSADYRRIYDEKSGYVITRKSQMEYELNPLAYTLYNGEEETQLKLDEWGWQPAY